METRNDKERQLISIDSDPESERRRQEGKLYLSHGELTFPVTPGQPKTYLVGIFHGKNMFMIPRGTNDIEFSYGVGGSTEDHLNNLAKKVQEILEDTLENKNQFARIVFLSDVNLGYIGNYFPTFLKDINVAGRSIDVILTSSSQQTIEAAQKELTSSNPNFKIIPKSDLTLAKLRGSYTQTENYPSTPPDSPRFKNKPS